jgi:hypothetical protein
VVLNLYGSGSQPVCCGILDVQKKFRLAPPDFEVYTFYSTSTKILSNSPTLQGSRNQKELGNNTLELQGQVSILLNFFRFFAFELSRFLAIALF